MEIILPTKPTDRLINVIEKVIDRRGLSDNVSLSHEGKQLVVRVSRLGTSTLIFSRTDARRKAHFSLTSEEIAMSHRFSYSEFANQLRSIVEEAGGEVVE
jgi:hypothetical protein